MRKDTLRNLDYVAVGDLVRVITMRFSGQLLEGIPQVGATDDRSGDREGREKCEGDGHLERSE